MTSMKMIKMTLRDLFQLFSDNLSVVLHFLILHDKHNIRTLSINIKFICTRCETNYLFQKLVQIIYIFSDNALYTCIWWLMYNIHNGCLKHFQSKKCKNQYNTCLNTMWYIVLKLGNILSYRSIFSVVFPLDNVTHAKTKTINQIKWVLVMFSVVKDTGSVEWTEG